MIEAAGEEGPVGEAVQEREGHVAGPDLQRDQDVPEARSPGAVESTKNTMMVPCMVKSMA